MGGAFTDELLAAWPPVDPGDDHGYRRVLLATMRPVAALPLSIARGPRAAAAVVECDAGHAFLPLVERDRMWHVARAGDGVAGALLARLSDDDPLPPPFGSDRFEPLTAVSDERGVGVDQTNRSVVVGGSVVVKWYTHPGTDGTRAAALLTHLGAVGFDGVPRLHAALTWSMSDGTTRTIALVDELLRGARDGWDWCVAAVAEHVATSHGCAPGCPATFASRLGALVSELHVALATPSPHLPDPAAETAPDHSALMIREGPRRAATGCETGDWCHVDVYLTKTLDYRALLLAGSTYDADALDWLERRGSGVVGVGGDVPGARAFVRFTHDDDPDVALHAETLVAELVAARWWAEA